MSMRTCVFSDQFFRKEVGADVFLQVQRVGAGKEEVRAVAHRRDVVGPDRRDGRTCARSLRRTSTANIGTISQATALPDQMLMRSMTLVMRSVQSINAFIGPRR